MWEARRSPGWHLATWGIELGGAFKFLRFHESLTMDITRVVYIATFLTPVVFPLLKLLQD